MGLQAFFAPNCFFIAPYRHCGSCKLFYTIKKIVQIQWVLNSKGADQDGN